MINIIIPNTKVRGMFKVPEPDSCVKVELINGEILEKWLGLDYRDFDFTHRYETFIPDSYNWHFEKYNGPAYVMADTSKIIQNIIIKENNIIIELLK